MSLPPLDPSDSDLKAPDLRMDRENAFLLYATFCGDVVRTAAALGVAATTVLKVADEENWAQQLGPILELKKGKRPGDIERAINRALNFVQAHKFRMFLQRIIQRITSFTEEEVEEYLLTDKVFGKGADGLTTKKLTTRALADLASALEKAHSLSYMALNDTAAERVKRKDEDPEGSASDLHSRIAEAMAKTGASHSPRAHLFDAQLSVAQEVVATSIKPASKPAENPLDNDDH